MMETYIGDGVYIDHDDYHVWLHTEKNDIALAPSVFRTMLDWVRALEKESDAIGFWTGEKEGKNDD